ncbi:hypothetical protein NDU88_000627 [Pleurodeles waltl]|uniref:Uncharacterized protein n=1 Tax=Pleurodeles waltl TaxID=8319 RepID=A0AAV7V5X3_PLEWA|nr:hypothetical protein NDU88_000627 [Pleurodeles waltl]
MRMRVAPACRAGCTFNPRARYKGTSVSINLLQTKGMKCAFIGKNGKHESGKAGAGLHLRRRHAQDPTRPHPRRRAQDPKVGSPEVEVRTGPQETSPEAGARTGPHDASPGEKTCTGP